MRALRERGWDGDDALADQLAALLETGPTPLLRPLPVDLEELAEVLEGDPALNGGRLDLLTGQVWPQAAIDSPRETNEENEEEADDPAQWLWLQCEGSRASTTTLSGWASRFEGRGAFRRFKDALARWPDELDRWVRVCRRPATYRRALHHWIGQQPTAAYRLPSAAFSTRRIGVWRTAAWTSRSR